MLSVIFMILLAPFAAWITYLCALAIAAFADSVRRFISMPRGNRETLCYLVVIPAHNEEAGIEATVRDVRARLREPGVRGDLAVIADNCSDSTAAKVRAMGETAWERFHETDRGKGYALAFAQERANHRDDWDVLVVIDADTQVAAGYFPALDREFRRGALAVQAHYGIQRQGRHWRQRFMRLAWSVFNFLRPYGQSVIGGSGTILGNGFALSRHCLQAAPFKSGSVVEDAEHGLMLAQKGIAVRFAPDAAVFGPGESAESSARTQRIRWEKGRVELVRRWIPKLLAAGNRRAWEGALALSVPPLVPLTGSLVALTMLAALFGAYSAALLGLSLLAALAVIVVLGVILSGAPISDLASVVRAPVYLFWKVRLYLSPNFRRQTSWVRTARANETR